MNTRPTSLTLLGLALGILIALLIAPQTRWLVRMQLSPSMTLPGNSEAKRQLFVQQHPDDFQVQLAGQPAGSALTQVEYERRLVSRFPDSASLRANILRYATGSEIHLGRDEDYLLGNMPVPSNPDWKYPLPTAAHLAAFDADAAAGERLDPDNAYFPFMRAFGLFAAHRDQEALAAVQRASTKPVWREYIPDEVEGRWRIIDAVYGGREAVSASAVAAAVLFPHYPQLRAAARIVLYKAILDEQAGHPEAGLAKREALGRCGELMGVQSTTFIGNLVGVAINAISRSRPGGGPPLKSDPNLSRDQQVQKMLNLYCAYVVKIGHPEAAAEARADYQNWQQIDRVGAKIGESAMGFGTAEFFHLAVALFTGWMLLLNVLLLLLLGLAASGLRRLPQMEARRSLPAGATVGFWSVLPSVLMLAWLAADTESGYFPAYVVLLLPLVLIGLLALFLPRLRRSAATALLSAGVTLGAVSLLAALAAWQMHGVNDFVGLLREFYVQDNDTNNGGMFEDKTVLVQTLLIDALGLTIPLLTAIVLSIGSRVKRVPVSAGLVFGFRAVMPPLVLGLMLVYGGLTLWTVQQEARANYGLERSLHGEGQYLAQLTGEAWPQR